MSSLKAKIANHILMQNDWMQTDLKKFAGNIILIKVSDIEIFFKINSEGQIFVIDFETDRIIAIQAIHDNFNFKTLVYDVLINS